MAILHPQATLRPTKLEVMTQWLPTRAWYRGPAAPELGRVASFRFDDPDGEVGIETMLVRAGDGPIHQVPLTYRGSPLEGHDEYLVGTSDHTALGPRWIYDGCGDPVYVAALTTTIITAAAGADEYALVDGRQERREPSMTVRGSGTVLANLSTTVSTIRVVAGDPTRILTDSVELAVRRILDSSTGAGSAEPAALTGVWAGQSTPVLLATLRAAQD